MMNINEIIGRVQSTIGDLEGERVQRGEYLKMLQDIGTSIAQKTESWVNRQIITPVPVGQPITDFFTLPYAINPFRIIQVYRLPLNNTIAFPGIEFSYQAVTRQKSYGYPFDVNDVQLPGEAFAVVDNTVNQVMTFTFVKPFDEGEQVIIDIATDNPFGAMVAWGDNTQIPIPNYLVDTFYYGLLHRAVERMMVQGDANQGQSLSYIQQQYETKLREAMTWNLMLKDKNSTVVHQSYKFLPDGDFW